MPYMAVKAREEREDDIAGLQQPEKFFF